MELLPRITLSSETGDAAKAEWRDATAMLFDAESLETPFRAGLNSFSLGDLLFGASASVAHRFVRDGAVVARSGIDHLLFQLYIEGGFTGFAEAEPVEVEPGDIVVFDLSRTFSTQATRFANLNLVVPRRALALELRDRDLHGLVMSPQTSSGRILAAHMKSLWSVCENATADDAHDIVRATMALVSAIVGELGRGTGFATTGDGAVRADICRHIEGNLQRTPLDAAYLCDTFGVSRSTLYRMFESLGGVATFVRNRRIEAAFEELSRMGRRSGRLDFLARKWGFSSEDSFARAFKARYGFNPNRMRREGAGGGLRADAQIAGSGPSLSDWFRSLGFHGEAAPAGAGGQGARLAPV